MKLYATVTSERATKGQGGNDFLQVNLQDENQIIFGTIQVLPNKRVYGSIHGNHFDYQLKGEKKKDEIYSKGQFTDIQ